MLKRASWKEALVSLIKMIKADKPAENKAQPVAALLEKEVAAYATSAAEMQLMEQEAIQRVEGLLDRPRVIVWPATTEKGNLLCLYFSVEAGAESDSAIFGEVGRSLYSPDGCVHYKDRHIQKNCPADGQILTLKGRDPLAFLSQSSLGILGLEKAVRDNSYYPEFQQRLEALCKPTVLRALLENRLYKAAASLPTWKAAEPASSLEEATGFRRFPGWLKEANPLFCEITELAAWEAADPGSFKKMNPEAAIDIIRMADVETLASLSKTGITPAELASFAKEYAARHNGQKPSPREARILQERVAFLKKRPHLRSFLPVMGEEELFAVYFDIDQLWAALEDPAEDLPCLDNGYSLRQAHSKTELEAMLCCLQGKNQLANVTSAELFFLCQGNSPVNAFWRKNGEWSSLKTLSSAGMQYVLALD